ncbi:MAG: hypothetical protein JXR96_09015 [Deltaproteobacteria bacterium]|nr:hypothetical protein [Deltaproteobacteria bacterium]
MEAVVVDTFDLTADTDFAALVRQVLLGRAGGSLPTDLDPADWLFRAYAELEGSPYRDRLAEGVSACLTDEEPRVRSGALTFFERHPEARGAERIVELAEGPRALFDGTASGTAALEDKLMRCVGARILAGDARAREIGRREALEPGRPVQLIAALTQADPDWIVEHAETIVDKTPATGLSILFNLQSIGRDVLEVGKRIARLAKRDRSFKRDLDRFIDDPGVREEIRAAMRERR